MSKNIWVGGLFLTLCGWACRGGAQEVVWRASGRPAVAPPPARLAETPDVGATLGRPVPVSPAAAWIDPGVTTASYHDGAAPTPVPRSLPDAGELSDAGREDLFASDRRPVRPAAYQPEAIVVQPRPGPAAGVASGPLVGSPLPPPPAEEVAPEEGGGLFGLFPGLDLGAPHVYARGEYLLFGFKKDTAPPLVTTSAPQDFGFLGRPSTRVLFGGDGLDNGPHSGGRFTVGLWLGDCDDKAVEVSGFFLPGHDQNNLFNSAQFPVLARPFFSLNRGTEFAQLTAFPGESTGNVQVHNRSDLWGLEANLRCKLCCGDTGCGECDPGWNYRVDALAGFRYLDLREDLSITENLINLPTAPPGRQNLLATVFDDFATRNLFYGGQVGLEGSVGRGPWSLDVTGKLAVGDTSQDVVINGGQLVTSLATGVTTPFRGGLLALPSNIGSHHHDEFSVVPEVNATVSYHFNEHWRVFAGYDLLYWTNVVRPGQQIDRSLDEVQIPNFDVIGAGSPSTLGRPTVPFRQSDFWAQGFNVGLEFRY